jgi:hypothetical protein
LGRLLRFEKRDVEFIKAPPLQAPVPGGAFVPGVIQITKATFGPVDGRRGNVKNTLLKLLPPGGMLDRPFQMEVSGAMFGKRDPVTVGIVNGDGTAITINAPKKQSLEVTYVFGNKVETVVLPEGSALVLPRPRGHPFHVLALAHRSVLRR